ncbi:MAG: DUF2125 domain-containing protein [Hellea sp.]
MSGPKKFIILIMTVFILFCVYWAAGRSAMINSVRTQIDEMQSSGYKVVHKGLSIGGFPLKFRARLAEPEIASPRSDDQPWSIKADDVRLEALTLNPLKWNAVHRGDARIDLRGPKGERWLFDARPLNIDMTVRAKLNGDVKAFDLLGTQLKTQAVIGTLPPIVAIDSARVTAAPQVKGMRFDAAIENIFLEKETLKNFQKIFGPRIESLSGQALAIGLGGLGEDTLAAWKTSAHIIGDDWTLNWGGTEFQGGFSLTTSETGLSGIIRIEVESVNDLIRRLEDANIFSGKQAQNAKLAAILLPVNASGRQEITMTFRDGFLTLFGQKIFEF